MIAEIAYMCSVYMVWLYLYSASEPRDLIFEGRKIGEISSKQSKKKMWQRNGEKSRFVTQFIYIILLYLFNVQLNYIYNQDQ